MENNAENRGFNAEDNLTESKCNTAFMFGMKRKAYL
jgi:hypothetical protein